MTTVIAVTGIFICPNPSGGGVGDIFNKSIKKTTHPQPFPTVIIDDAK